MKLKEIIEKLQLNILTGQENLDVEVTGGYTSDLLSDVIANSQAGNLWITLQTHQNIIAVAKLKDLAGIIIVNNREPDEETLAKAKEEDVPLLCGEEMAFEISGKLYKLLTQ
ncbi:MAG: serine kinase [Candidatus Aminicenantes bacterium]|jgi:serine kinase of HPr protein (carbohydrate metabolism regulator)